MAESNSNNQNYTSLPEPYDSLVVRQNTVFGIGNLANNNALSATDTTDPSVTAPVSNSVTGGTITTDPTDTGQGTIGNQSLDNLTITTFIQSRAYVPKKAGFKIFGSTGYAEFMNVYVSGDINAGTGHIGGWVINATTLSSITNSVILDAVNQRITVGSGNPNIVIDGTTATIGTFNFISGDVGWQINGNGNAEFNNIVARGMIRTTVFEKDTVSTVGGSLMILDGDALEEDMSDSY